MSGIVKHVAKIPDLCHMHFLQLQHRSRQEKTGLPPIVHEHRPVTWATIQAMEQGRDYLEYLIDGRALSDHLSQAWGWPGNDLHDNNVCPIGWFRELPAQILDLRRFMGLESESEDVVGYLDYLAAQYPDSNPKDWRVQEGVWTMFYCCALCGDPLCGGVMGLVIEEEDAIVWRFRKLDGDFEFRFYKPAYLRLWMPLLQAMESAQAQAPAKDVGAAK